MPKSKEVEEVVEDLNLDDDFQEVEDESVACDEDEKIPSRTSPDWSDYVMGLLTKDEKVKDKPRADGLNRVARMLNGDFNYRLDVHHVSPEFAAVTCIVTDQDGFDYTGSAECHVTNTDPPYNKYPLATAETRAIGRAMKRILGLTNVLTAEESSRIAELTIPESEEDRTEGSIQPTQINFVDRMCKKLNVNLKNAVVKIIGQHEKINDLSHSESLQLQQALDEWTKDTSEDPGYKQLGDYDPSWKSDFYEVEK